MTSAPVKPRSETRKRAWWGVLALFVGAAVLGIFGVKIVAAVIVAVAAVWGSVLLATEPFVVWRVPNLRGAIVLTGVVTAVGLGFFVVNALHPNKHAHAMESPAPSP
jgi:hypothetical protein